MVTHRSDPQKDHPCAEKTSLEPQSGKSVLRFDLGAGATNKVRTGQDSQKSHKMVSGIASDFGDIIMYTKFQDGILGGIILRGGVEFFIFLLTFAWAVQQCSATSLPVITVLLVCI